MIGFDSTAERRGFRWGFLAGIVAAGVVAMCMAPPAQAQEPIGEAFATAKSSDGATVTLYVGRGVCVGEARAAVWASPDGQHTVPGCWVLTKSHALISFLDGDRGNIPVSQLVRLLAS